MFTNYNDAVSALFDSESITDYSLKKVQAAYDTLGDPLAGIKIIHITGTNGKGSVCKMVYSILLESGYSVGIFTSPHILDIKERFQVNGNQINQKEMLECINKVESTGVALSYFERCTLIAFLFFQMKKLQYAIVEVGCGGLLDSTNIVNPYITGITNIGLDHTQLLGKTLEEIAHQKAGIIKTGVPVVLGEENPILIQTAEKNKAPIIFPTEKYKTNLLGEYQEKNAALAYEITKYIGVPKVDILKGLQHVSHIGRLDYKHNNLLIDGAHNSAGLKELNIYIESIKHNFSKVVYCIGLKKGKNLHDILQKIPQHAEYILVDSQNEYMCEKAHTLQKDFLEKADILSAEEIQKKSFLNQNTLYVVFGSLYMIGDFYTLSHRVIIGMGSSQGDKKVLLDESCSAMKELGTNFCVSSYRESEPWGGVAKNTFLNAACSFDTDLSPYELLRALQEIEEKFGRIREKRWDDRTLDLDILYYGDINISSDSLKIPHPEIQNRDFVTQPILELFPNFIF